MDNRKTICIGDIHGCKAEMDELLDRIDYDPKTIRLVFLGDLLHRGPSSIDVLRKVQELKVECVLANHESWHIRFEDIEQSCKNTGEKNPMRRNKHKTAIHEQLSSSDLKWIKSLPPKIHLKDNWYVVHGGCQLSIPFLDQTYHSLIRCRWVDNKTGLMVENKDKEQPKGSTYWAEVWNQPYNIVIGHHGFEKPNVFENKNNKVVAIDTRCVYGGSLTAFHLEENKFTQVKAKLKYY
jgi:hypothetical protein